MEDGVCRDAIAGRAGEGGRIEGVVSWIGVAPSGSSSEEFPVGHVRQAESGVSRRMNDQDTATLHSIVETRCFTLAFVCGRSCF